MNRAKPRFTLERGGSPADWGTKPVKSQRRVALAKHADPFELTKGFGEVKLALVFGDNHCVFSEQTRVAQEGEDVFVLLPIRVRGIQKEYANARAFGSGRFGDFVQGLQGIRF